MTPTRRMGVTLIVLASTTIALSMPPEPILLNLDAGEHASEPEDLWELFDILNIACGGHAGDERSMDRLVAYCTRSVRPRPGAHPSYPDRKGFGRVSMAISTDAVAAAVADQCSALVEIAARHAIPIHWMKPHGALYHDAAASEPIARAVLEGTIEALGWDTTVIGPAHGALRAITEGLGLRYLREGFADRRTRADGSLVPRTEPNALVSDPVEAASRARSLAKTVETVCVHADTPGATAIARAVRQAIDG